MRVAKLGDVCSFRSGSTLPIGELFSGQCGGWLLLKVAELNLSENQEFVVTAREWSSTSPSASTACPPDSIVLPKRGGAIATNKKRYLTRDSALDPNLMGLIPDQSQIHPRYLFTWLQRFDLTTISSGSTVPQLNIKDLIPLQIPLPALPEQRRIADVLDRAEALRAKRRAALALLDTLTQSIFLDMFGDPVSNPKRWLILLLGEVCRFYAGSSLPSGVAFVGQVGGYFLVKVSDMNLPLNETYISTSQQWSEIEGSNSGTCPSGTILIPKRGGAIGTNKKRITTRYCILDPNVMGIWPKPTSLSLQFLYTWFQRLDLATLVSGSSVPQLNKQDLAPITIIVPPLALQKDFARRVAAVEQLRSAQRASLAKLDELFASLQHRAFRGEL